jgi:hypothetical protein
MVLDPDVVSFLFKGDGRSQLYLSHGAAAARPAISALPARRYGRRLF